MKTSLKGIDVNIQNMSNFKYFYRILSSEYGLSLAGKFRTFHFSIENKCALHNVLCINISVLERPPLLEYLFNLFSWHLLFDMFAITIYCKCVSFQISTGA